METYITQFFHIADGIIISFPMAILFIIFFYKITILDQSVLPFSIIHYFIVVVSLLGLLRFIFGIREVNITQERLFGPYAFAYWSMMFCYFIVPLTLLIKKIGQNKIVLFFIPILMLFGRVFEKFVILVTSLHSDYSPNNSLDILIGFAFTVLLNGWLTASILIGVSLLFQKLKKAQFKL